MIECKYPRYNYKVIFVNHYTIVQIRPNDYRKEYTNWLVERTTRLAISIEAKEKENDKAYRNNDLKGRKSKGIVRFEVEDPESNRKVLATDRKEI